MDTGRVAPGPANPHQPTKKPAQGELGRAVDGRGDAEALPDATAGADQRMRARLDRRVVQHDLRAERERQPAERAPPDGNGGAGHDGPDVGVLAEAAERLEPPDVGGGADRRALRVVVVAQREEAHRDPDRGQYIVHHGRPAPPAGERYPAESDTADHDGRTRARKKTANLAGQPAWLARTDTDTTIATICTEDTPDAGHHGTGQVVERRDVDAGHSCGTPLAVAPFNRLQPDWGKGDRGL